MKNIVTILITALLSWLGAYYIGWWMVAVVPFLVAVIAKQKAGRGFLSGCIAIGLLWLVLILKQDAANDYLLSGRIAQVIGLSHTVFIIVNVILGALVGGLGGWSGAAMRGIFKNVDDM
ncbi:MAG: hypothetical protein KDC07_10290 [Chitinophagaceae bacterium]|nr:hypothetical protein [Chitinophagaceae bacterium]MCB9046033.1 hypothetical protein [Chitinophagales bacterium]